MTVKEATSNIQRSAKGRKYNIKSYLTGQNPSLKEEEPQLMKTDA